MNKLEIARQAIAFALQHAREVHQSNKDAGSSMLSLAFDAGRVDGLKQALAIIDDIEKGRLT